MARRIKDHPALLEYSYDEPDIRKITPEEVMEMRRAVKEADTVHPVIVNLCNKTYFRQFAPGTDVASFDNYPYPYSDLRLWRQFSKEILAAKPDVPFNTFLQTFQYSYAVIPTNEFIYAEFILSLIDGSRSLYFYCWNALPRKGGYHCLITLPEMQAAVRLISEHGKRLAHRLFAAQPVSVELEASPDIAYQLYHEKDQDLLLAVNISKTEDAAIRLDFPDKKLSDALDPAWTWEPGEKVVLKPYQTLIVSIR